MKATTTAAKRSQPAGILIQIPNVSTSNSRLYYLDGDSKMEFLDPNGTTGSATPLPVLDEKSSAWFPPPIRFST
ncbi:MAG: hypothetical protein ACYDA0_09630 [Candidatus Dormibacteraceae bacterium]